MQPGHSLVLKQKVSRG